MNKYIFKLDETSKKFKCPACGKKRFVRFVHSQTNEYADERFGRCDREIECRYFLAPKSMNPEVSFRPISKPVREPSFIAPETVVKSMSNYSINPFVEYLKSMFDNDQVAQLISKYKLGTSECFEGSVIFWQIDKQKRIRSGKIMNYDPKTGKRSNGITWVHKLIDKPDFELRQCLFGLHLVDPDIKKVAIVESEKTAILLSVKRPDIVWLATGSLSNFNRKNLEPIKNLEIKAFPDKGCYEKWLKVAKDCNKEGFNIQVSRIMENTQAKIGDDLADVIGNINYSEEEKKFNLLARKNKNLLRLKNHFDLRDKYGNVLRE